jgi:hypothetical protein
LRDDYNRSIPSLHESILKFQCARQKGLERKYQLAEAKREFRSLEAERRQISEEQSSIDAEVKQLQREITLGYRELVFIRIDSARRFSSIRDLEIRNGTQSLDDAIEIKSKQLCEAKECYQKLRTEKEELLAEFSKGGTEVDNSQQVLIQLLERNERLDRELADLESQQAAEFESALSAFLSAVRPPQMDAETQTVDCARGAGETEKQLQSERSTLPSIENSELTASTSIESDSSSTVILDFPSAGLEVNPVTIHVGPFSADAPIDLIVHMFDQYGRIRHTVDRSHDEITLILTLSSLNCAKRALSELDGSLSHGHEIMVHAAAFDDSSTSLFNSSSSI